MGCNNSKLNPSGAEALPARIRPLLRQRIEEFRNRRNGREGGEEGALSKKQLLKNDDDDDDNDGNSRSHLSDENETYEETQPPKEQTLVRVVPVEKLSKVVPLPVSECGTEEQHNGHQDHKQEKLEKDHVEKKKAEIEIALPQHENKHEEANTNHVDDDDDDDDDDDEEEEEEEEDGDEEEGDDESGRFIGPGSPSFRIYCIEAENRKEKEELLRETEKEKQTFEIDTYAGETEKEKEKQTIPMQKSRSTDSDESAASALENSGNSNEVVKMETTPKRKGHNKIKKLGAMKKNLLNVKNLQKNRMNRMMACTGNDRKSLLSDN